MEEQRYAVLIASSQYPQDPSRLHSLRCPERDVEGLNEILGSQEYGCFSNVSILKNAPHYICTRRIHQVLRSARRDDLVLIYYSGHGKLDLHGSLYLATFDTEIEALEVTSIPVESIRKYIYLSASRKVILILDCCYSGRVGEAFLKSGVDDQLQQVQQIQGGRGIYILTASTGLQVAQEKEGDHYSLLTKYVLEGIKDGNADPDGKGFVSIDDVYRYAVAQMRKDDFQEPMKWDLNVQGDELVIALTGKDSEERKRQRAKRTLYDLSGRNILPHRILTEAIAVLDSQPDLQLPPKAEHSVLLDQLVKKTITVGDFVFQWQAVTALAENERKQKEIRSLYSEAESATNQKDWSLAVNRLQHILALDAKHAEAQRMLKHAEKELDLSLKQAEQQPQSVAPVIRVPSDSEDTIVKVQQGEELGVVEPSVAKAQRQLLIRAAAALIIVVFGIAGFMFYKYLSGPSSSLSESNANDESPRYSESPRYTFDALQTIATELDPFSVALSQNGRFLGIIGKRKVFEAQLWQVDGKQRLPFQGNWGSLAMSPINDDLFAIGAFDSVIEVRRFSTKDPVKVLPTAAGYAFSLWFSPDGQVLVAASQDLKSEVKIVQTWRTQNWDKIAQVNLNSQEKISAVSLAINQMAVITPNDGIQLRSLFDGRLVKRLPGSQRISGDGAFSVDGKMLILGVDNESKLLVWKSFDENPVIYALGNDQRVKCLTIDPEGHLLAAGLSDGTFRVWRLNNDTEMKVVQAHVGPVRGISFSGDGRMMASVGADKLVKTWGVSQ